MHWSGSLVIEPGRLVYTGHLGDTHTHKHAAVQITTTTQGTVVFGDHTGTRIRARAAIIPAGTGHHTHPDAASGIMIYLDPTSVAAVAATARIDPIRRPLAPAWVAAAADLPTGPAAAADTVLTAVLGTSPIRSAPSTSHPCVHTAAALIPSLLADGPVRIDTVAAAVGISARHLGRLFARDFGLSFPAYIRWARLIHSADTMRNGGTLTDAAHAAGFTDAAHFNRVFHEMFGLAPSLIARAVTII